MEIVNTQNKVYNPIRRTYIDEGDCKEGELICPKCDGGGSWPKKNAAMEDPSFLRCYKCQGVGIIDWIEKVVGKALLISDSSSASSSSLSMPGFNGTSGISMPFLKADPSGQVDLYYSGVRNFTTKKVTNYKRRKVV